MHGVGLTVRDLPILRDVDTYGDALAVARKVAPRIGIRAYDDPAGRERRAPAKE